MMDELITLTLRRSQIEGLLDLLEAAMVEEDGLPYEEAETHRDLRRALGLPLTEYEPFEDETG